MEIVTHDALARLNALSAQSTRIQAAVAYWCMPHDKLHPGFLQGISAPGGYLCCDIHSPTSIDCLEAMTRAGGSVYLLLYQLTGKTEVPDAKGTPDHLMHSKVMVFNGQGRRCHVWIGSHNGTRRALGGLNYECAGVVETEVGSDLHSQVMAHLEDVRTASSLYELQWSHYYRMLQGVRDGEPFIELEDPNGPDLRVDEQISVFGTSIKDYAQLTKVGAALHLAVSMRTGEERLYKVNIAQTGRLSSGGRRYDLTFSARRHVFKDGQSIPRLSPVKEIDTRTYQRAAFFATLIVERVLDGHVALETTVPKLWRKVEPLPRTASRGVDLKESRDSLPPHGGERMVERISMQRKLSLLPEKVHVQTAVIGEPDLPRQDMLTHALRPLEFQERQALQSESLIRMRSLRSA